MFDYCLKLKASNFNFEDTHSSNCTSTYVIQLKWNGKQILMLPKLNGFQNCYYAQMYYYKRIYKFI